MGNTNHSGKTAKSGESKPRQPFQISQEPVVHGRIGEDAHKYELTQEPVGCPEYEDLGQLPQSYGVNTLYLVARDPHWLFCYWDVDWNEFPASLMRGEQRKFFLKVFAIPSETPALIEVNPEAPNWYIPVEKASTEYVAELGYFDRDGDWSMIVRSATARTPSDALSGDEAASFATLPLHLSFQKLIDQMQASMREGETLLQALARVQGDGRKLFFGESGMPEWSDEQKRILATIFGAEVLERLRMGSADMEQLLRKELQERLQSESSSEFSGLRARLQELAGSGQSSLFSAMSSWGPSEISSLFSAIGLWGPEVSSLFSAAGAWGPGASSSLSSAFAGWSPGVSSLFSALGFWGWAPGNSSLFSGIGASWSAQPFGQQTQRHFFMHVNAEVIFYGGTHPDAKVWIDGKQIQLNPDGSFRYHFRFPDGEYEIPILAVAPDGLEQRSATLHFRRETGRSGEVGSTDQPEQLKNPIGQI